MCGILGLLSIDGGGIEDVSFEVFNSALELLDHRGPNGRHSYKSPTCFLGHSRLSIIDLSANGVQPMLSSDSRYAITFNGEIYNFQELKHQFLSHVSFKTNTDTEVLLYGLIEFGIDFLQHCNGMFAFCFSDLENNDHYIARDRFGIKPLYYYQSGTHFTFSSEIKSILHLHQIRGTLNIPALSSYLSYRFPITSDTFFQDIFSLNPGQYIKIANGNVDIVTYYDLKHVFESHQIDHVNANDLQEMVFDALKTSVKYRMISDVPIGAYLSGGVDSSITTLLMALQSTQPVRTFTIGYPYQGYNEFNYAKQVSDQYKTIHNEIVTSAKDYIDHLEHLVRFKDAPLGVPNEIPLNLMTKALSEDITVVLSGEGADEIFGGYGRIFRSTFDYDRLLDSSSNPEFETNFTKKYSKKTFKNYTDFFLHLYRYTSLEEKKSFFSNDIDIEGIEQSFVSFTQSLFEEVSTCDRLTQTMYFFEKIHLQGLLHRVDVNTMANSVEARVPFVDHNVVELAFRIPSALKLKWKTDQHRLDALHLNADQISEVYDTPKYILKKAFSGHLPDSILYRKKLGFPVPLEKIFGESFNRFSKDILLSGHPLFDKIFSRSALVKRLENNQHHTNHHEAMIVWMLVNIKLFIDNYF